MSVKLQAGVFYGHATRTAKALGFRFTESSYRPRMNLPPHSHELAHFCLVLKGSYTERFGKTCEERRPSTLIFYPPDTVHAETSHTGGQHFLIEIESWRAEELRDGAAFKQGPLELCGQAEQWIVNRLIREFRDGDELSPLALESLALELMVNVARTRFRDNSKEPPKWLNQARRALEAKFRSPPTLEMLAAMVKYTPSTSLARSADSRGALSAIMCANSVSTMRDERWFRAMLLWLTLPYRAASAINPTFPARSNA